MIISHNFFFLYSDRLLFQRTSFMNLWSMMYRVHPTLYKGDTSSEREAVAALNLSFATKSSNEKVSPAYALIRLTIDSRLIVL